MSSWSTGSEAMSFKEMLAKLEVGVRFGSILAYFGSFWARNSCKTPGEALDHMAGEAQEVPLRQRAAGERDMARAPS